MEYKIFRYGVKLTETKTVYLKVDTIVTCDLLLSNLLFSQYFSSVIFKDND